MLVNGAGKTPCPLSTALGHPKSLSQGRNVQPPNLSLQAAPATSFITAPMRFRTALTRLALAALLCAGLRAQDNPATQAPAATQPGKDAAPQATPQQANAPGQVTPDELYEVGKTLFDAFAPEEVKREYEFPSRDQWNAFVPRLQKALEGSSMEELAGLEDEARQALHFLAQFEGTEDLCLWLRERLELVEAARDLTPPKPGQVPRPDRKPSLPDKSSQPGIPAYDYWLARLKDRPVPARADELLPLLTRCFDEEKSPVALIWLAEVESTFNAGAKSPAGAAGLYQLMPVTARSLGLSTSLPDERTHPEKSARAAARLLKTLHGKFGDWPLALAAYNAGEGRVRRLLAKHKASTFSGIAEALPVETRLYVPKVLATVATRTGVTPDKLR